MPHQEPTSPTPTCTVIGRGQCAGCDTWDVLHVSAEGSFCPSCCPVCDARAAGYAHGFVDGVFAAKAQDRYLRARRRYRY